MINPKELRIGSTYLINGEKTILSEHEMLAIMECDIKNIEAIPLTEEILISNGFRNEEIYGCDGLYFWEGNDISLTDDLILSSSNNLYSSSYVDGCKPMVYLHQLQNLHYALTGKEL